MTNESDSLRASCHAYTPDRPGACHDAKLTLYQLTVTLILCQLNQGFSPCRARLVSCVSMCSPLHFVVYKFITG